MSRTSSSNNHNPLVPSDRAFPLQLFKKKKKKKETKERAKTREKEKEKMVFVGFLESFGLCLIFFLMNYLF